MPALTTTSEEAVCEESTIGTRPPLFFHLQELTAVRTTVGAPVETNETPEAVTLPHDLLLDQLILVTCARVMTRRLVRARLGATGRQVQYRRPEASKGRRRRRTVSSLGIRARLVERINRRRHPGGAQGVATARITRDGESHLLVSLVKPTKLECKVLHQSQGRSSEAQGRNTPAPGRTGCT